MNSSNDSEKPEAAEKPQAGQNLLLCLVRLAQLQRESVDRLALQEAATASAVHADPKRQLRTVCQNLQVPGAKWRAQPDPSHTPALICAQAPDQPAQWGVLRGKNSQDQWISEWWDEATRGWRERADGTLEGHRVASLKLARPRVFAFGESPVYQLIRDEILSHRRLIGEAILAGLMINMVALTASFYSMQVYDRVVPTGASQTLLVLTLGALAAALFEWTARRARTGIYDRLIDQVDQRLARAVYLRFLAIRMDQIPRSVGGLAAQMRGYETVRGFFTSVTSHFLIDAPFALLFAAIIALIAGNLALVPLFFLVVSVSLGLYYRRQVDGLAQGSMVASNRKSGLLVETVEGAETIKSGQGGWRMLARWMSTTDEARGSELRMRHISEQAQHLIAAFQQISYILIVALGASLVTRGELTMGALIACSILSGRVLSPVALIPSQLVQWAHAKAALQGLDQLWRLQDDHHNQEEPVTLENIQGNYRLQDVTFDYGGVRALSVPNLAIRAGEKIGVLGPVGAGKTTLLRLLAGLYKPAQGRILLDDVDLAHIAKPALAERVGYVQQDGRLFSGTLRENLILGMLDPGEEAIVQAARATGLLQAVISAHPKGLQQEIYEGGSGLSGGQRQLVNLTRAFLRNPRIWLLDEPTASMDRALEAQVTMALHQAFKPGDTLILATHKAEMLDLVDRLIVIADHAIVLDGPKVLVLQKLSAPRVVAA